MATAGPKPGPTRTKTQREADRAETARLDRMGFSQREIAQRIGVSSVQICHDLKTIRKRYVEQANVHAGERIGELLAGFRDVRREAWLAWQKSWEDAVRVSERSGGLAGNSITRTREGRLPGAEYLHVIMATYEQERRLLGLDELSAADFLSVENVMALTSAIFSAIGRRVSDPQLVQAMKLDVLAMLPGCVQVEATTADAETPAVDTEPATVEPVADEPADAHQASVAADPREPDEPESACNGVQVPGEGADSEDPAPAEASALSMSPDPAADAVPNADGDRSRDWCGVFEEI